ncbi:MAG: exodeoxyribonuclease VII small subunit [Burkholderiales bacterium]|nr:exodeoxyribonuclease VII small subunit [Anaerolineae bacterium]
MNKLSELSFETAYAELETIITQLESGEFPLEESVTLFERGRKLSQYCQSLLDKAELRINQLSEDGSLTPLE